MLTLVCVHKTFWIHSVCCDDPEATRCCGRKSVATHCNTLTKHCKKLHHTAKRCNAATTLLLQFTLAAKISHDTLQHTATHCNTLQHTHKTLQHTHKTLQHTTPQCNTATTLLLQLTVAGKDLFAAPIRIPVGAGDTNALYSVVSGIYIHM